MPRQSIYIICINILYGNVCSYSSWPEVIWNGRALIPWGGVRFYEHTCIYLKIGWTKILYHIWSDMITQIMRYDFIYSDMKSYKFRHELVWEDMFWYQHISVYIRSGTVLYLIRYELIWANMFRYNYMWVYIWSDTVAYLIGYDLIWYIVCEHIWCMYKHTDTDINIYDQI